MKPFNRLFLLLPLMVAGCASVPPVVQSLNGPKQAVLVQGNPRHPTLCRISFWQKAANNRWDAVYENFPGVWGRRGLAPLGQKREGDGRSPSGAYSLITAFGQADHVDTHLKYRQAGSDDFWVDDPSSRQYNQWIKGVPQAASYERLRRSDNLYKLAIIIEYNMHPVVPGLGSAIFMHIWRRYSTPTAGCVATSERNLRRIMRRLDKDQQPVIILQ